MKNKKAQLEINHKILVEVMAAVFFALILFLTIKAIAGVLPGKHQADCANDKWWDDPRGLKEILKEVDKGKYKEFMFYNENCNLVSFSFRHGQLQNVETPIQHPGAPVLEPMLCLCGLDGDLCDPYDCYKFKNYKQINKHQFSTEPLEKYVFLKFIKQDEETLIIDFTAADKQPEPIKLEESSLQISPEAAKLIKSMAVLFNTREIKDFRPIVKNIQQTEDVAPEGIDNIKGFTFLFELYLANPPVYGQSIAEDYLINYVPINPNNVKQALIEFKIDKTKYNALDSAQKEKVALYFKKEDKYESVLMKCQEATNEIICSAFLNDFSSNFAVSVDLSDDFHKDEGATEEEIPEEPAGEDIYLLQNNPPQQTPTGAAIFTGATIASEEGSFEFDIVEYDLEELKAGGLRVGKVRPLSNIKNIVLHHTGGYRATYSEDGKYPGAIQTLQKRDLSAHYVLDRDGTLHYLVPENRVAYHAGCCQNQFYDTVKEDWKKGCCKDLEYNEKGIICKKRYKFCKEGMNAKSIGIEIVNRGREGDPITDEQYAVLDHILTELTQRLNLPYNDQTIIAHYEVTSNKNDPKNLEWGELDLPDHLSYEYREAGALPA